jgi:hypothetical protein
MKVGWLRLGVVFVPCLIAVLLAFADSREKCRFLLCNAAATSGNHQLARNIFKFGLSSNIGQAEKLASAAVIPCPAY